MSLGKFENESKHESVEQLWKRFKEIIRYCSDNFIPTRVKKTKRRNPWISRKIIHMKRKIKRLRRTDKASTEMSCVKKNLKLEIVQSKEHFLNNTLPNFLKNSPRKFWLFFKEANEGIDLIVDGKEVITGKSDIAGRLNQFIQSVFCKDQGDNEEYESGTTVTLQEDDINITREGIFNQLLLLDTKGHVDLTVYRINFCDGLRSGCRAT